MDIEISYILNLKIQKYSKYIYVREFQFIFLLISFGSFMIQMQKCLSTLES